MAQETARANVHLTISATVGLGLIDAADKDAAETLLGHINSAVRKAINDVIMATTASVTIEREPVQINIWEAEIAEAGITTESGTHVVAHVY
jgi:hypothetical protein